MRRRPHHYVGDPHHLEIIQMGAPHHHFWGSRIIIWRRPHHLNLQKTGLYKFSWFKFILKYNFWSISIDQNQKNKYFALLNGWKPCFRAWCGLPMMRPPHDAGTSCFGPMIIHKYIIIFSRNNSLKVIY